MPHDTLLCLYLLAATVWVGGMAMMHFVLRLPEPPLRRPWARQCS